MKKDYKPEVLRKLQLSQCRILDDFIEICKKYNLPYFIFCGCGIGVERHGGFIPWDDDIEIGMLRKDYDRFLEIAQKEYSDKYKVIEINSDLNFPFYITKFTRKGTKCVPLIFKEANLELGIDIEVYPFDNLAPKGLKRIKQSLSTFFWNKLRILREFGSPVISLSGWKKKLVQLICKLVHFFLKNLRVSRKFINRHYLKNAEKYNDINTEWVCCFQSTFPLEYALKKSEIFPLTQKKFEYLQVNVPRKNHDFLTRVYGDYMVLPPMDKRKNHIPYILEFGDFEDMKTDY